MLRMKIECGSVRSTLLFLIYDFGGIMDKYKKKKDSYNLVFAIRKSGVSE